MKMTNRIPKGMKKVLEEYVKNHYPDEFASIMTSAQLIMSGSIKNWYVGDKSEIAKQYSKLKKNKLVSDIVGQSMSLYDFYCCAGNSSVIV